MERAAAATPVQALVCVIDPLPLFLVAYVAENRWTNSSSVSEGEEVKWISKKIDVRRERYQYKKYWNLAVSPPAP